MKKLPLSDLNWDEIRLFLQIVRTGSLSRTARVLRMDQSTVSRRLAQFELCLGGALFERRNVGLKPTELAQLLMPHAEAMERAVLSLLDDLGGADSEPSGNVRIATMEGIGSMFVARQLAPLLRRYSKLRVELVNSSFVVNVSRREADIFLSFFKPDGQGIESELIGNFTLYLYGSKDYLAEFGTPSSVEDLSHHRFVGYVQDIIQVDALRWLEELVADPNMGFQSNSIIAQMSAAASGLGMVLLPQFLAMREDNLVPVLLGSVSVVRQHWLSVHHELRYSERIRVVRNYLADVIAKHDEFLNAVNRPVPSIP